MAEVQSGDNLPKKASGFLRREAALLHQVVEKLSSRNVFQDKVPAGRRKGHALHESARLNNVIDAN